MKTRILNALLLGTALCAPIAAAHAQQAPTPPAAPAKGDQGLAEIVVTGTAKPSSKIESSISVSTLSLDQMEQVQPQSSADLLRDIPGIRSEASGGEGNANIAVRGLPVASGGAKYVQFQLDGLPVMDFGDVAFATADTWIKTDYSIDRVEVVRGGSASTFASNAPGAVIDFISNTGETAGGNIGLTEGIDFYRTRLDLDYGGPIADGWRFHVGGFYREGDGVRTVDYTAENGGQLEGNITRELSNGFLRLDFQLIDDRTPAYLPVPIRETSSGFSSLPGFNALTGELQTPYLQSLLSLDHNGNRITTDVSDGYHVETQSIGGEGSFDLGQGWKLDDKFRAAFNSGDFVGPYPSDVDTAQNLANSIGGPGSTLRWANGPNAGQVITNPGAINGNGLAVNTVMFNVTLNDFNNFSNVLNVSRDFDFASAGTVTLTAGYFKSHQDLVMDWHWTSYLEEVKGQDAALLNVYNAQGQLQTDNGLIAYDGFGCGSCNRYYNIGYDIDAPFVDATWKLGGLTLDGSARYDIMSASGTYAQASTATAVDVNGNGVISVPEKNVYLVDNQAATPVNYTKEYISYSFGANYEIDPDLAVFARVSRGGRFNADRALPGNPDGSMPSVRALDFVDQQESGVKWRNSNVYVFATGFHATTTEYDTDITNTGLTSFSRSYESYGLELEGGAHWEGFEVNGGVTYTHARITADQDTPANINAVPQRQAAWVYQVTPSYNTDDYSVGFNVIGTSSSPAAQPSKVTMPGYAEVNAFGQYFVTPALRLSVNVNNLFDTIGITEVDQGSGAVPANGYATARSITGRSVTAGVKYSF